MIYMFGILSATIKIEYALFFALYRSLSILTEMIPDEILCMIIGDFTFEHIRLLEIKILLWLEMWELILSKIPITFDRLAHISLAWS